MGQAISLPFKLASTTLTFYRGFFYYLCGKGRYTSYLPPSSSSSESTTIPSYLQAPSTATGNDGGAENITISSSSWTISNFSKSPLFYQHARVHLYSLASAFYLYNKPHYRKLSYKQDIVDNFANVAIPGTGLPLSLFVWNKVLAFGLVCTASPICSFIASVHLWLKTRGKSSISNEYAIRLLAPDDWFSYWRLNCRVAGMHALLNDIPAGYEMENKWTFLEEGSKCDVPVSPYLDCPAIVVKHRNEEGGLGIHFYRNATDGGDWIIQERILNGDWVKQHLPANAPLSTFRVITQSRGALDVSKKCAVEDVTALSCVFRAGRMGALTDHDSILFDVDVKTGKVLGGTTNAHWYRLGLHEVLPGRCPWRSSDHDITHHPDGDIPVSGSVVPNIREMLHLVETSHWKLCPDVPLVGWDVVLSADEKLPVCLLEVNLSCNFFRGSFDRKIYLDFLEDMVGRLQEMRLMADRDGKKFK
ncbi:hypothetical protein ACHAWT_009299 [Skeletonema menzelii]